MYLLAPGCESEYQLATEATSLLELALWKKSPRKEMAQEGKEGIFSLHQVYRVLEANAMVAVGLVLFSNA